MKIQLVHPPTYVNPKALTALRPSPPLGLAYIAAALEQAGHAVSVVDAVALGPEELVREGRVLRLGLSPEAIVEHIDADTRAVGLTNMWSFSWPVVRELIHRLKERRPDVTLVCGGEHFNGLPEFSMQAAPIDYVVRGEGEESAVEIFRAIERGTLDAATLSGIASIVWRDGERIVANPSRARIRDVDTIPEPAWHLFDLDTYNRHGLKTGIDYGYMVPILATRGCPYECTYCSSPRMWTQRWYARDPEKVADEIERYVREYGANNFPFQDLTAIIRKDWIMDFCASMIRRGLDVRWQLPSGTRCEVIDAEMTPLLYQAGCRSLNYAPESGSDETRKLIKKKMKKESLFKAVDAAVKERINLSCFIVLGFPLDTDRMVRENLKFVRELALRGVDDIACGFFFPIPATELFDYLAAKGKTDLSDQKLLAPILVHDRYMTDDRNFSDHIPSWRLSLYRYLVLLNFYPLAFLTHPGRVFRTLRNVVLRREESKLDSFLNIYTKNLGRKLRRLFRRPGAPVPRDGAAPRT